MLPTSIQTAVQAVAVAEVSIDGLALFCFNNGEGARRWEVAYLRPPNHRLVMTVMLINSNDEVADVLLEPTELPDAIRSLDISLANGSNNHLRLFPNGGVELPAFSRNGEDSVDVRWAINMGDPALGHGELKGLKSRGNGNPDRVPVTLLRIPHTLFYTNDVTDSPVIISPQSADGPGNDPLFGRTNEETRGVIFADKPTDIKIVSDPPEALNIPTLTVVPGYFYRIVLTNLDRPGEVQVRRAGRVRGDLRRYYDVLEVSGEPRDLWALPRRLRIESGDCNPGFIANPRVPTLEPLIVDEQPAPAGGASGE
ncbi:MAG: hypothetical protein ICV60_01425 [Pyrinomonadaceae bacterium]|nr:hypothetical protein [Pyrinomonadaceae bacterium]